MESLGWGSGSISCICCVKTQVVPGTDGLFGSHGFDAGPHAADGWDEDTDHYIHISLCMFVYDVCRPDRSLFVSWFVFFVVCDVDQKVCATRCATICASRMCQRSRSRFFYKCVLCGRLHHHHHQHQQLKTTPKMAVYSHMAFTSGVVSVHNIALPDAAVPGDVVSRPTFPATTGWWEYMPWTGHVGKNGDGFMQFSVMWSDILSDKLSLRCIPCISSGTYWGGGLSLSLTHLNRWWVSSEWHVFAGLPSLPWNYWLRCGKIAWRQMCWGLSGGG